VSIVQPLLLDGAAWPIISQSNGIRTAASCSFTPKIFLPPSLIRGFLVFMHICNYTAESTGFEAARVVVVDVLFDQPLHAFLRVFYLRLTAVRKPREQSLPNEPA
jgi:hypothetical protein